MMIEQTVEVPVSHRLTIDVPREIPAGPTILAFRPMTVQKLDKAKPKRGSWWSDIITIKLSCGVTLGVYLL